MRYYLSRRAAVKWLEIPSVYHIDNDELYELAPDSFQSIRESMNEGGFEAREGPFTDYCMDKDILSTEPSPRRRPLVRQSPIPSLHSLEILLTDSCNLECKHCYIDRPGRNELPLEQVRAVLTEFEQMQGLRVILSGGEPLLHTHFDQINEMLADSCLRVSLFTNGVLLSKERLRSLNVTEIQVSIDGLEAGHDALRGPGVYDRAMQAVHDALDAGFNVSVVSMVHAQNLTDFDSLESLFRAMGIKHWTVDIPSPVGRLDRNRSFMVPPEQSGKCLAYGFGAGIHASGQDFGCGLHLMALMPDGRAAKCSLYGENSPLGIDAGLVAAWRAIKPVLTKDLSCDCDYRDICRGGCRYRAELLRGAGGKDPYRCALYGKL